MTLTIDIINDEMSLLRIMRPQSFFVSQIIAWGSAPVRTDVQMGLRLCRSESFPVIGGVGPYQRSNGGNTM